MKKTTVLLIAPLLTLSTIVLPSWAQEIPFPKIDSSAFCAELVAQMVTPVEKMIEKVRCDVQETRSEFETKPFWQFLDEKQQKHCLGYFTAPKFTSYLYLQGCMSSAIGFKCMRGEMMCETKG